MSKRQTKDFIFYCLLLAWPVAQFALFYISVNANSFLLAFKNYSDESTFTWVLFDNFSAVFERFRLFPEYVVAFRNSLTAFAVGTASGITLGIVFSYYIYKKAVLKNFFKLMLFLPSIIPSIAMIVMYKQMVDMAVPEFFNLLFGTNQKGLLDNINTTFGTILFYNVWAGFGVAVLLYVGAMERIPASCVEAAQLDGVGYFKELWYITLPMIWETMSTFIIVSVGALFVNQAGIVAFFQLNAEPYVRTIGYTLYVQTVKTGAAVDYPVLSAFGLLLSAVTIPLVFGIRALLKQLGPDRQVRRGTAE